VRQGELPNAIATVATVLWVGSLWVVGYLVVPILFHTLADRQLAGMLAGKLFTATAFVSVLCAGYLLLNQLRQYGKMVWQQLGFRVILAMLLLLLIGQWVLQPMMAELKLQALPLEVGQSTLAAQFKVLHGAASILHLLQSLLGLTLVLGLSRGNHAE
jgi:hypothetical protein